MSERMTGEVARTTDSNLVRSLVRLMLLVRRFEERLADLYRDGQIPGWLHTHIGQEALAVGILSQLRQDDYLTCGHRGHANLLAKGVSPARLAAEILGRIDGICGGRGGEVHLIDTEHGCLHTTGIVGQQTPLALGAAFRCAYLDDDRISVCVFGDGAVGQGVVHEALNLAVVLRLPLLLICENNQWAVGTRSDEASPGGDLESWAASYGLPTYKVDGSNVLEAHAVGREAIERVRRDRGPVFIECNVVRQMGHHMGDAQNYRSAEEQEEARAADVLGRFLSEAPQHGVSTAEIEKLEDAVRAEVDEAITFALGSPAPDPATLTQTLWAEPR